MIFWQNIRKEANHSDDDGLSTTVSRDVIKVVTNAATTELSRLITYRP
jgi:hypothetical protein